jgi:cytochrome c556
MKRLAFASALLAVFCTSFLGNSVNAQKEKEKEKGKAHTIKEIMKLAHTDKAALIKTIAADLKGDVKWDEVGKKTKELVGLSDELSTSKPPKGSEESWKKVSGDYNDGAKKLNEAAEKKELEAAKTALGTLQTSCRGCHTQHK